MSNDKAQVLEGELLSNEPILTLYNPNDELKRCENFYSQNLLEGELIPYDNDGQKFVNYIGSEITKLTKPVIDGEWFESGVESPKETIGRWKEYFDANKKKQLEGK